MHHTRPIRLLIADDHSLIREGFKNLFRDLHTIELVALAANGREAIEFSQAQSPDVVMMDIKMPVMCGKESCRFLQKQKPEVKVIALSMFDDEENLIEMRMAGACGYLLKNADASEITKAIHVVHEGGEYYSQTLRPRISQLFRNGKLGPSISEKKQNYSALEIQIIKLICAELTSKEIAETLKLNRRTIEHHKERIQEKMDVQSSVGIAVFAMSNWLLSDENL